MSFLAWLNAQKRRLGSTNPICKNALAKRPAIEPLEERCVLSGVNPVSRFVGPMHILGSNVALFAAGGGLSSSGSSGGGFATNGAPSAGGTGSGGVTPLSYPGGTTPTNYIGILGSHQLTTLVKNYQLAYQKSLSVGRTAIDSFLASQKKTFIFDSVTNPLNPSITIDRVLLTVRTVSDASVASVQSALVNLGMTVTGTYLQYDQITGFLPIKSILSLPTIANFASAVPVYRPVKMTGSVDTEGDKILLAQDYRTRTGFLGSGVGIGTISDSVNQASGGIASSQKTGDLPSSLIVLKDGLQGDTDEGRAMMEIEYDIAPGANLAFYSGDFGPADFAAGIEALVSQAKVRVVNDDLRYFDSPMFNDGVIADAANDVVFNKNTFYAAAAGNQANQGWIQAWNPIQANVGGITGTFEDVGNGTALQPITVAQNGVIQLDFQWDSAYKEGGAPLSLPNFQVQNNLDIYITDASGNIVASSTDINQNTGEAFENLFFANNTSSTQFFVSYQLVSGPDPTTLRWVSFADDPVAFGEGAPTTFGQAAANGVVAVGAVHWTTPNVPEPFTSQGGPIPIDFDSAGNRLAVPQIRNKPELAATDGVSTTFFGDPDPITGQKHAFFGTSAATPHVAGSAALYYSQAPTASPDDMRVALQTGAIDVTPVGIDNLTGVGYIQVTGITLNNFPTNTQFEPNNTSNTAHDFGVLAFGTSQTYTGLTIKNVNGLPDYDWYRWSMGSGGTFTSTIERTQGGTLELHVFTFVNGVLTELKSDTTKFAKFHTVSVVVAAGEPILVEVKGANTAPGVIDQGTYNMTVSLG